MAVGLHVIRRSKLELGQTVLIIGGGPIGLTVAIMAKIAGASRIIISEGNKKRIKLAEELGFETIDAFADNVADQVSKITHGEGFDVVYEVSGSRAGVATAISACKIRGTVVHVGLPSGAYEYNHLPVAFKELTVVGCRVYTMEDFVTTVAIEKDIIRNNVFDLKKLISDTMTLEELPKAIDMMIHGVNLAKIVIKL